MIPHVMNPPIAWMVLIAPTAELAATMIRANMPMILNVMNPPIAWMVPIAPTAELAVIQ
jgi:hypothetical protein